MKNLITLHPVISEKSLGRIKNSEYTFEVEKGANKYEIRDEVQKEFKVAVLSVRTMIRKGKTKQVGKKRSTVQNASRKFAIVRIKKDQSIGVFNQ